MSNEAQMESPESAARRFALRCADLERDRNNAYTERNRLVALLAAHYPSIRTRTVIEGWDPEWHGCVFIALPTGQASWHYHDSEAHLFEHVPKGTYEWDGHSTEEKYQRVAELAKELSGPPPQP